MKCRRNTGDLSAFTEKTEMKMKEITMVLAGLNFGRHIVSRLMTDTGIQKYVRLVGVCDFDRSKAEKIAGEYNLEVFDSIESICRTPGIDAAGLFCGPCRRAEVLEKFVAAGIPVMTTKPFELSSSAAEKVLALAAEKRVPVHLNSPAPEPTAAQNILRQWITEFQLGRPVSAHVETYIKYSEKPDGSWMDDPARCPAAPLLRLGIYGINTLIASCGDIESVKVVHSRISTGRPTADNAAMLLRFANGAIGTVSANFATDDGRKYPDDLVIHFEHGTVKRRKIDNGTKTVFELFTPDEYKCQTLPPDQLDGQYQWQAFARAVNEKTPNSAEYNRKIIASARAMEMLGLESR